MASVTFSSTVGGNGSTISDDSNPATGLGNGGHRARFVPALTQLVAIAGNVVSNATQAQAAALNALNAPGTMATSTTSLAIGTGTKTLTVQAGKLLAVGMEVTIASTASPANRMSGPVMSYNSATGALTVNVIITAGSGTFANWTVSLGRVTPETATVAEMQSGTADDVRHVTPKRVKDAIVALAPAVAPVQSVAGKAGAVTLTKGDVGLGNADNTADASKTVATAAKLTTARNITLGGVARSFDGSAAIAWTLAEIGAAPLASPAFTGTPAAPTPAAGTNTTQLATTAFVQAAVAALVASAPGALDTLKELADALGNDPNFATTMINALAGKQPSMTPASKAEMEAGTETTVRSMSPARIKEAIAALAPPPNIIVTARTSNTQLDAADALKFIEITGGTFTQTFAAAASLGNGWWCYIRNSGSGTITLDPNGSEQIDGLTSGILAPDRTYLLMCTGTGFVTRMFGEGVPRLEVKTASGSWTCPLGIYSIEAIPVGGGGGGSNAATGGAGGVAIARLPVTPGTAYSYTVGAGGTVSGQTGYAGGDSTFVGVVTVKGLGGGAGGSMGGRGGRTENAHVALGGERGDTSTYSVGPTISAFEGYGNGGGRGAVGTAGCVAIRY